MVEPETDHWLRKLLYDAVFDATTAFLNKHPSLLIEQGEKGKTFPWNMCSVRTRNAFERSAIGYDPKMDKPTTYGEMIEFGASRALEFNNVGVTSTAEIGDLMGCRGLRDEWDATHR